MTFANPDTPRLLADVPGVEVVVQNTTNYFRLDVSAIEADSPFTDLRVRQAAHYALDCEAISNIVFGGDALVDYPVPVGLGYEACRDDPFYVMPREERLAKARSRSSDGKLSPWPENLSSPCERIPHLYQRTHLGPAPHHCGYRHRSRHRGRRDGGTGR